MGQEQSKTTLFIKVTLGETQSHDLFDFQNGGIEQESLMINEESYLVDKGETVEFLDQYQYELLKNDNIERENNVLKVTIDPYNVLRIKNLSTLNNTSRTMLWRCVKPNEAHPIKVGDMIKIGKIKLELKKIIETKEESYLEQETVKDYHEEVSENINDNNHNNNNDDLESLRSGHSSCDRCRICFRSFNVKNDPLLCLCKCSGSIKWIHFLCLKDWIANNFQKREDDYCKFYTYHETNCELCKHSLPNEFKHEGRMYSFLDFSSFEPPYAEFEYAEIENNKKKFYKYIISLQKDKEVVIGRNNSSQVVMKDISISRTHCSLEYNHGVLLLRDKKSKFGTLIKLEKEIDFSSENGLQLQYDSKIIDLYNNNTFKSCCQDVDSYRLVYESEVVGERSSYNYVNSNMERREGENNTDEERRLVMMRMDNGGSSSSGSISNSISISNSNSHQSSSPSHQSSSESNSHHYLNQALDEAEENNSQLNSRRDSARVTMIRETLARDEAIRY